ncbi:MAG: SGNH/GDSL hydrolase family protein [Clostridia bacterium]|nr:SGNH/GDSL hydrolase family protein [Clostridia bacterium]
MKLFRWLPALLGLLLLGCAAQQTGSAQPESAAKPERYRIACLGDSITEGVGVSDPENLWVNVVGREDFIIKAQNVGSSGTTIAVPPDESLRPYAFVHRYHEIDERAALIIVFGGTNDYGNDVPLGTITDTDPMTFYGALNTLVKGLRDDYPNAKLLFLTPLQRDDKKLGAPTTSPYNAAGVSMEDYRQAILSVCEKNGVATIDLYNLEGMRLEDATFAEYFDDGLHPNDAGSLFLAKPILAEVKNLLGQ